MILENLLVAVKQYSKISEEAKDALIGKCKIIEVSKNELLLNQGRRANQLYFVNKGILRTYYIHNGKDVTSWIYPESYFATSWHSFLNQKPSFEHIQALEDSELVAISAFQLNELYKAHQSIETFGRRLMEVQLAFIDEYSKSYSFLSANEKYQILKGFFPEIELRVKLGHIASLLGISQETLSRIRGNK